MKLLLERGDKVRLLNENDLFTVLHDRNFSRTDDARKHIAKKIGGTEGRCTHIELKYADDYFTFNDVYSLPYEAIDVEETVKLNQFT